MADRLILFVSRPAGDHKAIVAQSSRATAQFSRVHIVGTALCPDGYFFFFTLRWLSEGDVMHHGSEHNPWDPPAFFSPTQPRRTHRAEWINYLLSQWIRIRYAIKEAFVSETLKIVLIFFSFKLNLAVLLFNSFESHRKNIFIFFENLYTRSY